MTSLVLNNWALNFFVNFLTCHVNSLLDIIEIICQALFFLKIAYFRMSSAAILNGTLRVEYHL